jgi:hypothetical protein
LTARAKRRICVYNFGVGFYYSTQERIALEKLLIDGFVPHIAFFIDGINEGIHLENRPWMRHDMKLIFDRAFAAPDRGGEKSARQSAAEALQRLPFGRAVRYARRQFIPETEANLNVQNWQGHLSAVRVCETYLTNKYLIEKLCQRFEVTPIFIWQPSPAYNYDLKYHLFAPPPSLPAPAKYPFKVMREYYPTMRGYHDKLAEDHFLWCADIQQNRKECLYCDRYHYTGAFAKELAEYICRLCVERQLLANHLIQ